MNEKAFDRATAVSMLEQGDLGVLSDYLQDDGGADALEAQYRIATALQVQRVLAVFDAVAVEYLDRATAVPAEAWYDAVDMALEGELHPNDVPDAYSLNWNIESIGRLVQAGNNDAVSVWSRETARFGRWLFHVPGFYDFVTEVSHAIFDRINGTDTRSRFNPHYGREKSPGSVRSAIVALLENDEWKHLDPSTINDGFCNEFAYDVCKEVKGAVPRYETVGTGPEDSHTFIVHGGRFYDAESFDGVDDWHHLPWFRRRASSEEAQQQAARNRRRYPEAEKKSFDRATAVNMLEQGDVEVLYDYLQEEQGCEPYEARVRIRVAQEVYAFLECLDGVALQYLRRSTAFPAETWYVAIDMALEGEMHQYSGIPSCESVWNDIERAVDPRNRGGGQEPVVGRWMRIFDGLGSKWLTVPGFYDFINEMSHALFDLVNETDTLRFFNPHYGREEKAFDYETARAMVKEGDHGVLYDYLMEECGLSVDEAQYVVRTWTGIRADFEAEMRYAKYPWRMYRDGRVWRRYETQKEAEESATRLRGVYPDSTVEVVRREDAWEKSFDYETARRMVDERDWGVLHDYLMEEHGMLEEGADWVVRYVRDCDPNCSAAPLKRIIGWGECRFSVVADGGNEWYRLPTREEAEEMARQLTASYRMTGFSVVER